MSSGRLEFFKLLSSNHSISICYWVELLNLFEKYRDELDIDDVKLYMDESELCRHDFNSNNIDKIRKEEVRPNIHSFLNELEAKSEATQKNYNKESLPTNLVAVAQ